MQLTVGGIEQVSGFINGTVLFEITDLKQDRYGSMMGTCRENVMKPYGDSDSAYLRCDQN